MSGRTYTVNAGEDRDPILVPDGKWVIVATRRFDAGGDPLAGWEPDFEIFGPRPQEILLQEDRVTLIGARDVSETRLLVGSEPFGIINREFGRVWFEPARQIHKGQLGKRPPLPKLEIIRETEGRRKGRAVQNPAGWVRVNDVAQLIGMTPLEMLLTYYDFDDAGRPVWINEGTPEQIRESNVPCAHFPGSGVVGDVLEEIEENGRGEAWIRLGFARTILYLHRFGWEATHNRRREQRELIASLQKAADLLESDHPERASEVRTWVNELQLELA